MKGQSVGNTATLLWPSEADLLALRDITCQDYVTEEVSTLDLLWPAALINEQAQLRTHHSFALPLAVIGFVASALLAFAIGPMQMILVAMVLDYNWVTTAYYPQALHIVLTIAGIVALIDLIALALTWRDAPERTYLTTALATGSLIEIFLIWMASNVVSWAPHVLTLILALVWAAGLIVALFISKQYISRQTNNTATKVVLSLLLVFALTEICLSGMQTFGITTERSSERAKAQAALQEQAHHAEVTRTLSDLTYVLCGENYRVVYQHSSGDNGLFECQKSGEVYSVTNPTDQNKYSLRGNALYLGTTRDDALALTFPNSYFLYRALPEQEYELVLMTGANSEQELVDNITDPLLNYWREHHDHDLFVNIFHNSDLGAVATTKDYILMTALDTMTLNQTLPRGNNYEGYLDGKIVPYNYQIDNELAALNELAADHTLYPDSTRIALTTHRHIAVHLLADSEFDYETLHDLLADSFVGGIGE